MSRTREVLESAVLVAAILVCAALWSRSGLQAKDEPKEKHKCPLCGSEDVTFENTPEGAFAQVKFAMATVDVEMLKAFVPDVPEQELAKSAGLWVGMRVKSCKVDGDQAVLTVSSSLGKDMEFQAVRREGTWTVNILPALAKARNEARARDCINNLRQLGTYTVMYVSKYGSDRYYSGPGIKILTDLFNLPTPEKAIASGNYGLLLCKVSGETWDDAHEKALRVDDPACSSYECVDQKLSDGTTQPEWPIAWDKKPHPDGKRNVLFFSGHAAALTEEEFQAALALWPKK